MQSKATTVAAYLASLPPDRRAALSAVRQVILDNLDPTYVEGIQYGMIGYAVPHSAFPAGYHCDPKQPLPFAALGSNKGSMSLHLMCVYFESELRRWFETAWKKSGKKLDMGKACVRFKSADDVPLDVLGALIKRVPAKAYIAQYETALSGMDRAREQRRAQGRPAAKSKPRPAGKTAVTSDATSHATAAKKSASKPKRATRVTRRARG